MASYPNSAARVVISASWRVVSEVICTQCWDHLLESARMQIVTQAAIPFGVE